MSDSATPGELGAFISYSRRDEGFVAELKAELEANGLTAWKDEDNIPPGAPWRVELGSAIEAALALVFVISPDSIASDECRKELERALELGKRIIPVLWRPVEALPESLRHVQHVRADRLDVTAAAAAIVRAVGDDPEWTRAHTYWTARAVRWEDPERRGSLPAGHDLRDLQDWLAKDAENREPRPAAVHQRFAAAARRRRRRIRRGAVALATGVVAVAGGLTAWGLVNQSDAIVAENTAASRALARQSSAALSRDVDLSALLAVEASRKQPTDEARDALHAVLPLVAPMRHALTLHTAPVTSVAYSPDGKLIASGGEDSTVRLWSVAGRQRPAGQPLRAGAIVHDVAFSPRGDVLAVAERNGNISLWQVAGREQIGLLRGHRGAMSLAFSSDGDMLVSAGVDDTIRLWDVPGRRALGEPIQAKVGGALDVALSPDDQMIATSGLDGKIRIFDVATRKAVGKDMQQGAKDDGVFALAFTRDGLTLLTAGGSAVRRWDVDSHRPAGDPLVPEDGVSELAVSPDGRTIATASDHTISVWDLGDENPTARLLPGHTDAVNDVTFSPDGALLASGADDRSVRVWDVSTPSLDQALTAKGDPVHAVAVSADGKLIASAHDKSVRLWDAARRVEIKPALKGHSEKVSTVAFTPDGRTLLSGGLDGLIGLWSVADHTVTGAIACDCSGAVTMLAVNPAGTIAASGGIDNKVRFWNLRTQKLIGRPIVAGDDFPWGLAFSPDGKTLAGASLDHTVRLWDVASHKLLGSPIRGHANEVRTVAFSPDGRLLATGGRDQSVRLWDVATRRQIGAPMTRHRSIVASVAFTPDGRTLASAAQDGSIRLWDVATHAPIGEPLTAQSSNVAGLAFSPDGKLLVSGAGDTVQFWNSILWTRDLSAMRRFVCERIGRNLTHDEWDNTLPDDAYRATCALDSQAPKPVTTRPVIAPKRTFVLAPGDSAKVADSNLTCSAGGDRAVVCGFEAEGNYPEGSLAIGMTPDKAIVVESTDNGLRMRHGNSFSSPRSGAARPRQRTQSPKTFTLHTGDAAAVAGTAIQCAVRAAGSIRCGAYLRGTEVPLTPLLTLDRARAKIIGVGPDGEHKELYHRDHGVDGLL
ncbi:TIR domain-containing protein [Solirubrobacter ginsenosidimutans]|uniref:TIR domain-containing protein n=1 Tax=Solirubrobacter ginsenosidimutans TaxID=490573 RepID=A0A9X3S3Z4_9ACTN|nr:TIR domain-containing protein [Solirubrobacter ginsenosidimutans]MDA0160168.1 TIR domain-containing protein [Solirubrobacter ginsenosidimutans]